MQAEGQEHCLNEGHAAASNMKITFEVLTVCFTIAIYVFLL